MPDLRPLLSPKSVAIIGAAPEGQGLRGRILEIMRAHPYSGAIYPVSRSHAEVQGLKAYPSIGDVPGPVDLAVLIIPAKFVPEELERCGRAGARSAIVISSGFAEEPGEAGSSLQDEVRNIAKRYGMAVMGPNSEGFANLEAALCPTFSPAVTPSETPLLPAFRGNGRVAVIAQSGGMGFAFFDRGRPKEMAFNYIVTTGNEACLEAFDVVEHLLDEGRTDAFLLLLEDIKTSETFRRASEKALRAGKPIIVNKIGQSDAGRRAAASHTAAMAGSYATFQAMARHYGLIEGRDLEEMVDIAQSFLAWGSRLPQGRRVAICTASGGGGGWMADACITAGLEVPEIDAATRKRIDAHLPSYGTSQNPIDGTAQAIHKLGYAGMADLVMESPAIDSVIVIMSGRAGQRVADERETLIRVKRQTRKPILMWSYTLPVAQTISTLAETGFPVFTNMRNCVSSLAAMAQYNATRQRFLAAHEVHSGSATAQREQVAATLRRAGQVLTEAQSRPLLAAYGIGKSEDHLAKSADEAVAAFKALKRPVALKVQSPDILHKTDAGAVALKLATPDEVASAYDRVLQNARRYAPAAKIDGVLVQPMAPPGREVILGINRDEVFGPMLMLGIGGIHVEVLKDVVFAPVPLSAEAARDLIGRLKGAPLLGAHRGEPAADIEALVDAIVRLSQFAADQADQIAEIDLNPVIVHAAGQGATVVDALIVKRARS
ncbi:MAG TPA: acetate--CoA ligase family protein [Hyphomicrobiaceae bacterium]|nr:acetate--CoA ligase family protein [Hyphomicrobiaceae bacterium]